MSFLLEELRKSHLILKDRLEDRLPRTSYIQTVSLCFPKKAPSTEQLSNWDRRISTLALPAVKTNKELLLKIRHQNKKKFKRVAIQTVDKVTLDTVEIIHPSQKDTAPDKQKWLIFFNGNNGNYEQNLENLTKLSEDLKINVYSGNYRGVGGSKGFPSGSQDLVIDGEAMLNYLIECKKVEPKNIIIHGWSIGGAVALSVVSRYQKKNHEVALCHDRSFSQIENVISQKLPIPSITSFFVNGAISQTKWSFGNLSKLYQSLKGEKFFIYNPQDDVVDKNSSLYLSLKSSKGKGIILSGVKLLKPSKSKQSGNFFNFSSFASLPTDEGQYAHCVPVTKIPEKEYKKYLNLVHQSLGVHS